MVLENLEAYLLAEKNCENETVSVLEAPIELNNEIFEFYLKTTKKYCYGVPKSPDRPVAVIILNYRILKSIACLSVLLKKGQYAEFQSILRDVFEALSKSEYMLYHPEISDSWLRGERINFSKVSKKISLPESLNNFYGELCHFTHANSPGSKWEIIVNPKNPEHGFHTISLSSDPVFRKDIAYFLIINLISFTIYAINNYLEFTKRYCEDIDNEDTLEYNRLIKKIEPIDNDYHEFSSDPKNTEWRTKLKYR
jgi:hypothetical protein